MSELLERLDASLGELAAMTKHSHRVGPFRVFIDPLHRDKYGSFAQPDQHARAAALAAALPEVLALFGANGRQPRTEHIEEVCPALADVVEAAGWTLSERVAVMVVTSESFRLPSRPDGLTIERLEPDAPEDLIHTFSRTQDRAFGGEGHVMTAEAVAGWRERAEHNVCIAGRLGGEMVGTAVSLRATRGASEVVGVATLPGHRRRGIAAALTGAAVAAAFAGGAEVSWLSAADAAAERIYGRLGFRVTGAQRGYDGPT